MEKRLRKKKIKNPRGRRGKPNLALRGWGNSSSSPCGAQKTLKRGIWRATGSHGADFPQKPRKIHEKTWEGWEGIIKWDGKESLNQLLSIITHYFPLPFASPWDGPRLWKRVRKSPWIIPRVIPRVWTLTFLHHPDVHAAFEPAGLAVPPVVLGDVTVPAEGTGEHGFPLHAPPEKRQKKNSHFRLNSQNSQKFPLFWVVV